MDEQHGLLLMIRRGGPERICRAQRAGLLRRLADRERVNEHEAEHLISRCERQAEPDGRSYWDDPWRCIEAELAVRKLSRGWPVDA